MRSEVESFFASYCQAFNMADPVAVTRHIAAPSILLGRTVSLWQTDVDVLAAMERLLTYYRNNGYRSASLAIEHTREQGADYVTVDVLWTIERDGPPWRFHTGYTLRRSSEGWKAVVCTAYEEPAARLSTG